METEWRDETTYADLDKVIGASWITVPITDRYYLESDDPEIVSYDNEKTWTRVPTKRVANVEVAHRTYKGSTPQSNYFNVHWVEPKLPEPGQEIRVYHNMARNYLPACFNGHRIQLEWRQPPIPKGKRKLPPMEKTGEIRVV